LVGLGNLAWNWGTLIIYFPLKKANYLGLGKGFIGKRRFPDWIILGRWLVLPKTQKRLIILGGAI